LRGLTLALAPRRGNVRIVEAKAGEGARAGAAPRDLIVIGAGPAGAAAARAAVDAGFEPLILDAEQLPRAKACAGLVPAAALALAEERFGPTPQLALASPMILERIRIHLGPGESYGLTPRWPAVRVQRREFDAHLLAQCGAEVRSGVRVERLEVLDDRVRVLLDELEWGEPCEARAVVVASGAGSKLAPIRAVRRWLAFAGRARYQSRRPLEGWEFLLLGDPDDGLVMLYPAGANEVGITTTVKDPRRWKLAHAKAVAFAQQEGLELINERGAEFGWVARGGPWLGKGRVLVAGDAGGLGLGLGLGIEAALRSGFAAGEAAARFLTGGVARAEAHYAKLLRPFLRRRKAERGVLRQLGCHLGGFDRDTPLGRAIPLGRRRVVAGVRLHRLMQALDADDPPPRGFPL